MPLGSYQINFTPNKYSNVVQSFILLKIDCHMDFLEPVGVGTGHMVLIVHD